MKKKTLYLTLSILFAIMAVACVAVLIICANAMLSNGSTSIRIWGTIAVGVGFLICCALLGVMYALYSHEKNPNIIKQEVQQELDKRAKEKESQEKASDINQID